jgi:hypothetical protein
LQWYISVIYYQTQLDMESMTRPVREQVEETAKVLINKPNPWGYFWTNLPREAGDSFDHMTLWQASDQELKAIRDIVNRAFAR